MTALRGRPTGPPSRHWEQQTRARMRKHRVRHAGGLRDTEEVGAVSATSVKPVPDPAAVRLLALNMYDEAGGKAARACRPWAGWC